MKRHITVVPVLYDLDPSAKSITLVTE